MSHQSKTSVNSYSMFQRVVQSRLQPDEIADPATLPLPPFYNDTPEMRKAYARIYDCITLVDKQVGAMLSKLEQDGLADDTIVFLYADHGQGMPRFKSSPYADHGQGMPRFKSSPFALGLHVPLIIRVPEKFRHLAPLEPGTTDDRIVSFVDFGPTVLSLCGAEIPAYISGVPFLGPRQGAPNRYFYGSLCNSGETEELSRTVSDGRYVYVRLTPSAAEYMAPTRPPEALYDLENDPWEIHNLAGDPKHAATLQRLREANKQHLLRIRDVHFMHPAERTVRAGTRTVSEMRLDEDAYPLERILQTAEMAGMGKAVLGQQLERVKDPEPLVRYWAVIGLQSQKWTSERILQALRRLLVDPARYVRHEAAALCYKHDKDARAKDVLLEGIKGDSSGR